MRDGKGPDGLYDYQRQFLEQLLNEGIAAGTINEMYHHAPKSSKQGAIPETVMTDIKRLGHSMQGHTCIICGWTMNFDNYMTRQCTAIEGEVIK